MSTQNGPILLITDLSARCDRAMDRAIDLAKIQGVKLIALHVIETAWLTRLAIPDWHAQQQQIVEQAQSRLHDDFGPRLVDVELRIETGDTIDVIEKVTRDNHCRLIVAATARDETLGRLIVGNTVEQLARRLKTPLLIVRRRPLQPYAQMVVTTDFSDGSATALETAHQLFNHAAITIYHAIDDVANIYDLDSPTINDQINTLAAQAEQFVQNTLQTTPADLSIVVEQGPITERLPALIQANHIPLTVIGTRGVSGVVRLSMGSVAEALTHGLTCDVLLVPQAAS